MTALEIMTLGAARASFTVSSSTYLSRSRQYLNDEIDLLLSETDWSWRFKNSTITLADETQQYALASDVMYPGSFWDQTNNNPLKTRGPEFLDSYDPDRNEEGTPTWVIPIGISNSTGYWQVLIVPEPTAAATVGYWYWAYVPKIVAPGESGTLTDSSNMDLYIPRHLQPALYHGIAAKFFGGKGARNHADMERAERDGIIGRAKDVQSRQTGRNKTSLPRVYGPRSNEPFDFVITGALSP